MVNKVEQAVNNEKLSPQEKRLRQLQDDLIKNRQETISRGDTERITTIDKALEKVSQALEESKLSQKITNSRARLGLHHEENHTANNIQKIKVARGMELGHGQKFASMESNARFMKANIGGLFDLIETKV